MVLLSTVQELNIESLIADLAFILLLGAVTTVLFKWLKQPVVLGYIVAGFLASPHFSYLPSVTTPGNIDFWAEIGIVILLYSLGLEFSFKKLVNAGGSAVVTALIIVTGMMIVGFSIGHILGFSNINSLFLGGMLSMSSTTIIIKAFSDLGIKHKKFAGLVFAVLIVEDLFAVLMMVILSSIAVNRSVEGGELLWSVGKLVFFLVIWFLVGVYILPSLLNSIRRYLNSETLLVVGMGLCLGMAVFSVYCGFSLALGAFVMGSILGGTSFAERIEKVVTPVKDLFGAVFFISVGMMVNPQILVQYIVPILLISSAVIVGMILFGTTGMLVTGQPLKIAMESGFSLAQIGEFAFIIASLGMSLGVLEPNIYPIVVAVSVITTFTTPYFIKMADPAYRFTVKHLPKRLYFLVDRYSDNASSESETGKLWKMVLARYIWRILLYSILLIAIIIVSRQWLLPWISGVMPQWGRLAGALITLALMSPFLVALSYPASKKTEREHLRQCNARFDAPLIAMSLLRVILMLAFIFYTLASLYSLRAGYTVGIGALFVVLFLFSKNVRKRMKRIEKKFMNNLNERELRRSGKNNKLVSDMHLAYVQVGVDCPFVGEQLKDSRLHSRYGINVASIQRGSRLISVPGGDTRIFPGDTLAIIGNDESIQEVLPVIERQPDPSASSPSVDKIKLRSITLSANSPLIGRKIADSGLRDRYQSMLVAVCRNDEYITSDFDSPFRESDILWLVGDPKTIETLR